MAVTEYTEVQSASWTQRVGGSFKGVLFGLGMIICAIVLLFWNEGRAVKTAKALDEGAGAVISVQADKVDPANEGKLVHVSGKADTKEFLEDTALGVKVQAIKLKRKVEIYQWVEHKKTETVKKGDKTYEKTTYTYSKEWCANPVDSSAFKEGGHVNAGGEMAFQSADMCAKDVTLGAFKLSARNISRIGGEIGYAFPADYKVPETVKNGQFENNIVYVPVVQASTAPAANVSPLLAAAQNAASNVQNAVTHNVAAGPQIGDLRIRLRVVMPHDISLCQKQVGESFAGWKAGNGRMIELQADAVKTAEEMFESAKEANTIMTWILRGVGFFLLFIGFKGVFGPIAVLVDVVPLLNGLVSMGVGLVSGLLSVIVWLTTVAFAWIFYRPVLGVGMLVVAVALIVFIVSKKKQTPAAA